MDTVLELVGSIGKENLTTQGKKRLNAYNQLVNRKKNLEKAFKEADEDAKANAEEELDELNDYYNEYRKDFINFLQDEKKDLADKAKAKKDKEAQEQNPDDPSKKDDKNNSVGLWTAVGLSVITLGAYAFFKNRN